MSDMLFGGEVSGTPIETRGGTERLAGDLLSGGRLAADSRALFAGLPGGEAAAQRLLVDPRDRLRGLFAAMEPFEARQTEEAVAGVRSGLGRLGGRFGRSALEAETRTRGELANQFTRARQEAILQAEALQSQTLAQFLNAILQGRGQTLSFFQPGAPNFREGLFGDLIEAGGNVAAARVGAGA